MVCSSVTHTAAAHPRRGQAHGLEFEYAEEVDGKLLGKGKFWNACDQLFKAIGREPGGERCRLAGALLELERGRLKVDAERRTWIANISWQGLRIAGGKDLTVVAVEDGEDCSSCRSIAI